MRTIAANVAARVAVGGDDMLSKWQLMAEQAKQMHEGGTDVASATQSGKDVSHKSLSTSGRTMQDNQDGENRPSMSGPGILSLVGRHVLKAVVSQTKIVDPSPLWVMTHEKIPKELIYATFKDCEEYLH